MSDNPNTIRSAEEEQARADAVYKNPRIVQAYQQALKEESLVDKLLEYIGVPTHRYENLVNSHLSAEDKKMLVDYINAPRDVPAQDRARADLVRSNAEDDFSHNVTGCPRAASKNGGSRSL